MRSLRSFNYLKKTFHLKYAFIQFIFHDGQKKEVKSTWGTSTVRNMLVEDPTGSVQVTLWNNAASASGDVGQTVMITHLRPQSNKFMDGKLT